MKLTTDLEKRMYSVIKGLSEIALPCGIYSENNNSEIFDRAISIIQDVEEDQAPLPLNDETINKMLRENEENEKPGILIKPGMTTLYARVP